MTNTTRMILILFLTLMLAAAGELAAQETTTSTATSGTSTTATSTTGTDATTDTTDTADTATETAAPEEGEREREDPSYGVRRELTRLLVDHPDHLATIVVLEPSLLSNAAFLAQYPQLAAFLDKHPEVRTNPTFYLAEFRHRANRTSPGEAILEPLAAFCGFLIFAFALAWFVRTILEQRRWTRLAKTQTEVHNKILDRFSTSEELLQYMKTPSGTKFLESAPIALHTEPVRQNAPLARVLLTIQAGVVAASAGLGLLLVSARYSDENGEGFFGLGVIALSIGLGFIGSSLVTLKLSRRLGLWQGGADRTSSPVSMDEQGVMR